MTNRVSRASRAARPAGCTPARRRGRRTAKTLLALLFLILETFVALGLVAVTVVVWKFSQELPGVDSATFDVKAPVATTIWSQDGVLLGRLDVENRQPVTLSEVPKNAVNATVAIEDHRFFEHHGVDPEAIVRALWSDISGHNMTGQGASTLTQQLVRNTSQFGLSRQKRYSRKIREALYAMRLEQVYTKNEILQLYLNGIYYGSGANGIGAAARTYFGKPTKQLDLAQSALLAGLPQRPSAYSPYEHRKAAIRRQGEVLDAMLRYGYISQQQADHARSEKLHFAPRRDRRGSDLRAPYFTTDVLKDLMRRYGPDYVFSGLRIETTLNWRMQLAAERMLEDGIERDAPYGTNQGALVCLENHSGFIRAEVGGRSFHADQYNAVTQGRRQPGSAFKIFDYAAAFDTNTADLHTAYRDVPIPYPGDPEHRIVRDYEGDYTYRRVDCLSAIKLSLNTIAVQVARDVGIKTVIAYAHRMGVTTELDPFLPTALGASSVRPLDLAAAYSIVPNKGTLYKPTAIVRVTDADGNVIEEHQPQATPDILKADTIDQLDTAFEAVVTGGTGTRARGDEVSGIVDGARGKTGTNSGPTDTWFAGYTPELTTVVWVASAHRDRRGKHLTYSVMRRGVGGTLCAPIWHDFMIRAVPVEQKMLVAQAPPVVRVAPPPPQPDKTQDTERTDGRQELRPREGAVVRVPASTPPLIAAGDGPDGAAAIAGTAAPTDAGASGPTAGAPPPATTDAPPTLRSSAPTSRPASLPPTRSAAPADLVAVTVCADSGLRATEWCPVVKTVMMTRRQAARLRRCRMHRPPPGEG